MDKAPKLEEIKDDFLEFIKDKIIICHNKQFEEKFLEFHIGELKNKFLDSMELACVLEPFQREFNLDYLKKQITKDKNDEKHRALSDTIDTIDVVNALILRFKDRLEKELEVNVGLKVEPMDTTDGYKVSGRGELHLSILLENMRREGYEIGVSKPEVLMHKTEDGRVQEPIEKVIINCPEVYSGTVINKMNLRKGMMEAMSIEGDYVKIEFSAPTRGLLGYRSEFINDTRGEGNMVRSFARYEDYKGEIPTRNNGVLIAQGAGTTMAYGLNALSERAQMFVEPGVDVYEGMIIGMNSRREDMVVNPCKNKKLTNVRASGSDDAIKLNPARTFTLEEALEFIDDDELVEITPDSIRLRKKYLKEHERLQYNKQRQRAAIK